MDSELVLDYARERGWTPLSRWSDAPREQRLGHPVFTQQLLLATELGESEARAYEAVGRPHAHPELNVLLHVMVLAGDLTAANVTARRTGYRSVEGSSEKPAAQIGSYDAPRVTAEQLGYRSVSSLH